MKKLLISIILIALVSGCLEPYNPYQRDFAGNNLNFRADLDEARKIPVYPNETTLRNIILNNNVEEIVVAYIPNDTENSYYLADSFELAYKLTIINRYFFKKVKPIDSIPVNSSLEAFYMSSAQKPVILLFGPSKTNSTMVNALGYLIAVQGRSLEEKNVTYTELDLATDKLLLVLMEANT
jgi:hypothetical protein